MPTGQIDDEGPILLLGAPPAAPSPANPNRVPPRHVEDQPAARLQIEGEAPRLLIAAAEAASVSERPKQPASDQDSSGPPLLLTAPTPQLQIEAEAPRLLIAATAAVSESQIDSEQHSRNTPLLLTAAAGTPSPSPTPTDAEQQRQQEQQRIIVERDQTVLQNARKVSNAYADFFNHISLRRGWKTVPFTHTQIAPLLDEASHIVARLRYELDAARPEFKLRMVDGSAREYLWTVSSNPSADPGQRRDFVRNVVHATFRDQLGYVEGLTSARVELEIAKEAQRHVV